MKQSLAVLSLMLLSFLVPSTQALLPSKEHQPTAQTSSNRGLITRNSIGAVRLGMTVAQARKALRGTTLSRTSDGEGLALIAVTRKNTTLMTLFAGETNPDAPINQRAKVEHIEALDSGYRTASGVHPKMYLRNVEGKFGKLKEVVLSEIEAREFATFTRQPAWLHLRLRNDSGMAGIYAEGQTKTEKYEPSAYVFSISIHGARN
jgi:hypothetical protein